MIDDEGYRANVGIVITNDKQQILLAKRLGQNAWQLPQGGINENETELEALFRELNEEVGLSACHVEVVAKTPKWLRYNLPTEHRRRRQKSLFIGQKQVWFLLRLTCDEHHIKLDGHEQVEFDDWQWVDYWRPIEEVIDFKKSVYEDMLKALAPIVFNNEHRVPREYSRPLKCSAIVLSE